MLRLRHVLPLIQAAWLLETFVAQTRYFACLVSHPEPPVLVAYYFLIKSIWDSTGGTRFVICILLRSIAFIRALGASFVHVAHLNFVERLLFGPFVSSAFLGQPPIRTILEPSLGIPLN